MFSDADRATLTRLGLATTEVTVPSAEYARALTIVLRLAGAIRALREPFEDWVLEARGQDMLEYRIREALAVLEGDQDDR